MTLRDSNNTPGAVHDLTATLTLSSVADQVLFVSQRTLRLLANLAEVDIRIYSRYAKAYHPGGMIDAVDDDDSQATDVDIIANKFGIEVVPVGNWIAPGHATAIRTAATQTIATATDTKVVFDSVINDPEGIFSLANDWAIIPVTGHYLVVGRVAWAVSAVGYRFIYIYVNGASYVYNTITAGTTTNMVHEIVQPIYFGAGDKVELYVRQNTGGNLDLVKPTTFVNSTLAIYRIG